MKSYKEIAEALKGKQHKIDKNKNGKIDAHDFKLLRKEENELTEATVKTQKYSWGTMKTVHHGADFSIPLHPEHHQAIAKLKDEQEHKFKDETGRHWVARRKGEHVHFDTTGNGSMKTHVPLHTMKEEYENEVLSEEDHSELARKAAAEYRKALARGDSVAANAANAEHIRHKKAAEVLRKKSHTPGEMDEAYESPLDTPAQKKAREDLKKTLLDIKKKNPNHPATKDIKETSDHDPWHDAQENKKSAESAKKQGDSKAYHMHMADHHENMAQWSMNRGRHSVANQHQMKADQHHDWAHQVKEEHVVESHVEFRIDHREKVTGDHKSTFADHDAKVSDTTDKATYVKVPSHKADSFKSAMKSKHGARVELAEETVTDLDKYFDKISMKGGEPKKAAPKKEPENTITGSQIKFLNTFREETDLNEKMNLAKADMGDVIKDFQKSDAPQFAGKTKEKRRQMAIAAKLEADRQQNEGVIQPTGSDAIDFGVDKPKDTVVRDKKGKLISFKHEGAWKKSTGTITDKSGAKHGPMSQVRHLARSAMKTVKEEAEDLEEGYVVRYHNPKSEKHGSEKHFDNQESANKHAERGNSVDKIGGKYTVHKTNEKGHDIKEQAPVAPVPGQKWKDHAVMVNGRQRVVIHRKNIGNYSKEDGWKEVAPGQKVKEDVDMDGNYVSEPMSYQEFAMMLEARAQYLVKATHNKTGRVKVSNYVADKDESEYGVRSRAEREHKPMGYSIDSVRKKDVEAHGEGDEEESTTQKRGRGRPAGSKSGARGPRIK